MKALQCVLPPATTQVASFPGSHPWAELHAGYSLWWEPWNEAVVQNMWLYMSMFANNALLRGRVMDQRTKKDQKKIKGTTKPLVAILDICLCGGQVNQLS